MKGKIIFHIGLRKTGTTFLQKNVFPLLFPSHYIRLRSGVCASEEIISLLGEGDGVAFLLSSESFSGAIDPEKSWEMFSRKLHALEELRKSGYEVLLVLVLRNHEEWLRSAYLQRCKKSNAIASLSLDEFAERGGDSGISWERRLQVLKAKEFPTLVLDYEDLRLNPKEFVLKVINFAGEEVDERILERVSKKDYSSRIVNRTPQTLAGIKVALLWRSVWKKLGVNPFVLSRDRVIGLADKVGSPIPDSKLQLKSEDLKARLSEDWSRAWDLVDEVDFFFE